ncbi:histone H2B.3-like [Canna indica]|uniref:Histone H2B.3-like n=1 Tax=Canna indica TaxID=4628 RepID=A0AAQ3Q3N9_9LILI|nr:histone H2B.3-like [Canna indica]
MAPKRAAKVVKTTKKVVKEIVEVISVGSDSQNSLEPPPVGDSKSVEVVVEAKEAQVPIAVNVTNAVPAENEPEKDVVTAVPAENEPEEDVATAVPAENEPEKDVTAAATEKEAEPPAEKSKAEQKGKEAESIADKETQEEKVFEAEEMEKGDKDKEAEPRTPKKVEQPPKRDQEKGRKRGAGGAAGKQTRRKKRRFSGVGEMDGVGRGYKRYVFQVLKQVHPDLGISARAMAVIDGMMGDMFERLTDEAGRLSMHTGKKTLTSREIEAAVRLVLPGELGKHAIVEATKAIANYMAAAANGRGSGNK